MSDAMVKGFDAAGNRVLVPASKAAELADLGGRIATEKEIAEAAVQARYDARPTSAKVLGGINTALNLATGNPLVAGAAGSAPPELAAYGGGVANALTLGGADAATRKLIDAVGGKQAGATYAQQRADEKAASPVMTGLGEAVGIAGSASLGSAGTGIAARFLPGAAVSALGNATEAAVVRGLGGMATRGALGRAAVSAASLGAQGAVEGSLYGAAQSFNEDMLGDHEVAADRVFAAAGMGALYGAAGGAALGGAGSLAKSGVQAVGESVGGGLARMASGKTVSKAPGAISDWLENAAKTETQKGWAYDKAFEAIGGGMHFSPTRPVKQAARYLPNGTTDLGEIAIRHGIIDVTGDASAAFMNGKPAEMIPKAAAAEAAVGQRIGELTMQSGATVAPAQLSKVFDKVASEYEGKLGQTHIGAKIRNLEAELHGILGTGPGGPPVTVQALLEQRKALDEIAFKEAKALDPNQRVQALRDVRSGLEDLIADSMDAASGRVGGAFKAEYKNLKKDFMGLRMINEVLEDSAARQAKAATFGLTSVIAGAATGGIGTGLLTAVGVKMAKERGSAAAAVLLYRMAEAGTITRTIQSVDAKLGRAASGLLNPAAGVKATSSTNPVATAQRAASQLATLTSSPGAVANRAAVVTQSLGTLAPNVAGNVARNMTRALAFLNSKLPPARNIDPLAPKQERSWSTADAVKFSRYVEAAEDPQGVLDDVASGKVTPEAIETLRVLTPTLYRDLQVRTLDAIGTQLATGKPVSFDARIKLGTLLGIQADPSQNPRVRAFLQGNITQAPAPPGGSMQQTQGPASKPITLKTQHSALDRLAESGPGRR